jgi:hypothetical protein
MGPACTTGAVRAGPVIEFVTDPTGAGSADEEPGVTGFTDRACSNP